MRACSLPRVQELKMLALWQEIRLDWHGIKQQFIRPAQQSPGENLHSRILYMKPALILLYLQ